MEISLQNTHTKICNQVLLFGGLFAISLAASFLGGSGVTHAQATCSPETNFGLITKTVAIDTNGTYDVWSRVKSPDGNPTYTFSVDGAGNASCDTHAVTTTGASNWKWVKSGTFTWSGGDATVYMSGNKASVGLDCVVLTTDVGFTPTGASDCVAASSGDTASPTVQVVHQNNTLTQQDSFTINVNADDNVGVTQIEILVNDQVVGTDNLAPYAYDWNVRDAATPNADYAVTARASDAASNQGTASPVTIRVRHPDINRNNSVDIFDLSRLLSQWSQPATEEDLNGSGTVDIFDLSTLLASWGQ